MASQQGEYLAKRLNGLARHPEVADAPFNYRHLGQLAYIGGESAAVDLGGGHNISGWGTHRHTTPAQHTHHIATGTGPLSLRPSIGYAAHTTHPRVSRLCECLGAYWLWKGGQLTCHATATHS